MLAMADGNPELQRIEEQIRHRIQSSAYVGCFGCVAWRVESGVAILEGRVQSFYFKQLLQSLLREIDGVEQIRNCVEVVSFDPRRQ